MHFSEVRFQILRVKREIPSTARAKFWKNGVSRPKKSNCEVSLTLHHSHWYLVVSLEETSEPRLKKILSSHPWSKAPSRTRSCHPGCDLFGGFLQGCDQRRVLIRDLIQESIVSDCKCNYITDACVRRAWPAGGLGGPQNSPSSTLARNKTQKKKMKKPAVLNKKFFPKFLSSPRLDVCIFLYNTKFWNCEF